MSFWNSKYIKKTKKKHRCEYCGATIKTGSPCYNEVGTYENEFNSYYMCERCRAVRSELRSDEELGWFWDDLLGSSIIVCPRCGDYNLREYAFSADMMHLDCECDACGTKWTEELGIENIRKMIGQS